MEFAGTSFKTYKRALLILPLVTTILSSTSETLSRVKRQTLPLCKPGLTCTGSTIDRFRTIDGTCNNLAMPDCGASEIPFVRLLNRSPSGDALRCPSCPRPRDVSSNITNIFLQDQNDGITLMVMQWGQFIDHDLVFTPVVTDATCCRDFQTPTGSTAACLPIDVTGDSFYSGLSTTVNCLPFVRSSPATCRATTQPAGSDRQNINERTAYLDGSVIYGSTETVADSLRTFSGGQLKISSGSESLPCSGAANVCPRTFLPVRGSPPEFFTGDPRVEETPGLTSIHTLFLRLHNFLASELNCPANGGLGSDEVTYQVTRKIVGAVVQQVTYNEFLPIVLGPNIMNNFGLDTYNGYDSSICASAPNVFATAAFRFGHSLIPNVFNTLNGPVLLERTFNNHDVTLNPISHPSHFIQAIVTDRSMPMDHRLVQAVTNKLFAQGPNFEFGSDLFARNTKRGRDHGIPGYIQWVNLCHSVTITSFDDLFSLNVMPAAVVEALQVLYNNRVEDIDLFPAGIAEFPVAGGLIGPTLACIIADHFANLKDGDRFWFERDGFFTPEQTGSLRRTRLSSIVCAFTAVDQTLFDVMLLSSPRDDCSFILEEGLLNDFLFSPIWNNICFQ